MYFFDVASSFDDVVEAPRAPLLQEILEQVVGVPLGLLDVVAGGVVIPAGHVAPGAVLRLAGRRDAVVGEQSRTRRRPRSRWSLCDDKTADRSWSVPPTA